MFNLVLFATFLPILQSQKNDSTETELLPEGNCPENLTRKPEDKMGEWYEFNVEWDFLSWCVPNIYITILFLPVWNFFPMRPISSPPSTEPSVKLAHQTSGKPAGPAANEKRKRLTKENQIKFIFTKRLCWEGTVT